MGKRDAETSGPGDARAATVGAWLGRLAASRDEAWVELDRATREMAPRVARWLGVGDADAEDAASEARDRILDDHAHVARRCHADASFASLVRGVLERVLKEQRRERLPTRDEERLDEAAAPTGRARTDDEEQESGPAEPAHLDLAPLTPKQREALELELARASEREAARREGVSRAAHRGRRVRAVARLRRAAAGVPEGPDRSWARDAFRVLWNEVDRRDETVLRDLLLLAWTAEGFSYARIARSLRMSKETVRHRVRRLRALAQAYARWHERERERRPRGGRGRGAALKRECAVVRRGARQRARGGEGQKSRG